MGRFFGMPPIECSETDTVYAACDKRAACVEAGATDVPRTRGTGEGRRVWWRVVAEVVVLDWDPAGRVLTYVEVGGGNGGPEIQFAVSEGDVASVTAALSGRLPAYVEVLVDGEDVLVERLPGEAMRCKARSVGSPTDRLVQLRQSGRLIGEFPAAAVGLNDPRQSAETIGDFLLLGGAPAGAPIGCWICPGGLSDWRVGAD